MPLSCDGLFVQSYFKLPWETDVFSVNHFWQLYPSFCGIIMTWTASGEEYVLEGVKHFHLGSK